MLRLILKQLWNQRKQNVWIFLELIIAGIFLWSILDPLCVNYADKSLPKGWDDKGVYKVSIKKYGENSIRYNASIDSAELCKEHYRHLYTTLANMPEIADYAFMWDYPNSGNNMSDFALKDSANIREAKSELHVVNYTYQEAGSDMFKTFGFMNALTNKPMTIDKDAAVRQLVYVSEDLALSLYGTADIVGKTIWTGTIDDINDYEIGGVFKTYKFREMMQPVKHVIHVVNGLKGKSVYKVNLFLKLKDGVNEKEFVDRFNTEVKPTLKAGNFYCSGIDSYVSMNYEYNEQSGVHNEFRKNTIFVIFGVLCVFLGMVGTFWITTEARRQEIGVMRSIGASKRKIVEQFLAESLNMVTIAFAIVLVLIGIYVYKEGFFTRVRTNFEKLDPQYWQNNDILRFVVVSAVTYLIMLVTSIIGTVIPVVKASQELPADALRDE